MYKLTFFVPQADVEEVKQAVFGAGAGQLGNYCECSWQVLGEGQFRPGVGSKPSVGTVGELERVREFRVEMLCKPELANEVIAALKRAHPYEEPAYEFTQLVEI